MSVHGEQGVPIVPGSGLGQVTVTADGYHEYTLINATGQVSINTKKILEAWNSNNSLFSPGNDIAVHNVQTGDVVLGIDDHTLSRAEKGLKTTNEAGVVALNGLFTKHDKSSLKLMSRTHVVGIAIQPLDAFRTDVPSMTSLKAQPNTEVMRTGVRTIINTGNKTIRPGQSVCVFIPTETVDNDDDVTALFDVRGSTRTGQLLGTKHQKKIRPMVVPVTEEMVMTMIQQSLLTSNVQTVANSSTNKMLGGDQTGQSGYIDSCYDNCLAKSNAAFLLLGALFAQHAVSKADNFKEAREIIESLVDKFSKLVCDSNITLEKLKNYEDYMEAMRSTNNGVSPGEAKRSRRSETDYVEKATNAALGQVFYTHTMVTRILEQNWVGKAISEAAPGQRFQVVR